MCMRSPARRLLFCGPRGAIHQVQSDPMRRHRFSALLRKHRTEAGVPRYTATGGLAPVSE